MKTSGAIVSDDRPWQKKNHLNKMLFAASVPSEDDASSAVEKVTTSPKDDINVGDVLAELAPMVIDSRDESSLIVSEQVRLVEDEGSEVKREEDSDNQAVARERISKLDDDISVEFNEIVGNAPTIRVSKSPITTPSPPDREQEEDIDEAKTEADSVKEQETVDDINSDTKPDRQLLKGLRQSSRNLTKTLSAKLNSMKKTQEEEGTDEPKRKSIKPQMSMPKILKREKKEKQSASSKQAEEEDTTDIPQSKTSGYGDAVRVRMQKIRGVGKGMKKKASTAKSRAKKLFSCKQEEEEEEEIVLQPRTIPKFSKKRVEFQANIPTIRRRRPLAVKIHMRPKRRGSEIQRLRDAKKRVVVHTAWIRKLMKTLQESLNGETTIDGTTKPDAVWVKKLMEALVHLEKRIDADTFEHVEIESESPKRMYLLKQMREVFEEERRLYPVVSNDGRIPSSGWVKKLLAALEEERCRIEGKPVTQSPQDEEKSLTTWAQNMVDVLEVAQHRIEQGLSQEQDEDSMLLNAWVKRVARALEEEEEAFKEENPKEGDPKLVATWILQMTNALEEEDREIEESSGMDEELKPATEWMEQMLEELEKEEKEIAAEEARLAILNTRSKWMVELLDSMEEADIHVGALAAKKHWVWIKNMVSAIDEEQETVTKEMLPILHEPVPEDDKTTLSFPVSMVTPSVIQRSTSLVDATHSQQKLQTKNELTNIHQPVPQGDDHTTLSFHSSFVSPTIVKRSKKDVIVAPKETRRDKEVDAETTGWLLDRLTDTCAGLYCYGSTDEHEASTKLLDAGILSLEDESLETIVSAEESLESIVTADTETTEKN